MRTSPRAWLAIAIAIAAAGCEPQPDLLCDRARVVWPFLEFDPSSDSSPDEGLQVDLDLRSSLLPGTVAYLFITGEDGVAVAHPDPATVDEDGDFSYDDVTLPLGRVQLTLSIKNGCGAASTGREIFVWDGAGYPRCTLTTSATPADEPFYRPLGGRRAEHDGDQDQDGLQREVAVDTDRPDMTVSLFVRDVASGEETAFEEESGEDEVAEFELTLPEGEQAIRAVCLWAPADLHPSSITERYFVDTESPSCELLEPTNRVLDADDEDGAAEGTQFTLAGRATGDDVVGEPAAFDVDGTEIPAGALDQDGEASAVGTVFNELPPQDQVLTFRARDRAGNTCEATETF